jgi:tetratricopeptide (TPR) repeat protein
MTNFYTKGALFVKNKVWLLPVTTSILVIGSLAGYYLYDAYTARKVEEWRNDAETLALEGNYGDSRLLLEQALDKRPNHKTLQKDLDWVKQGEYIRQQIQDAEEQLKQQQFQKAISIIEKAELITQHSSGLFYEKLGKQLSAQKMLITVAQIKNEIPYKKTIEELGLLLGKLSGFQSPEAEAATGEIGNQIGEIAYGQANDLLAKKQFSSALAIVEQALQYNPEDNKLLSFKNTIEQQKQSFEQAERQRIEQAMAFEAKETAKDRTRSVEVVNIRQWVSNSGDFHLSGEVRNIGSHPIKMIQIHYDVYDSNGQKLVSGQTYAYPNYLGSGETGRFENTHFGLWKGNRLEITKLTWFLDK